MEEGIPTKKGKKKSYTGAGIALGAGVGSSFGLLFMDGNIAVGAGIGVAIGIVIGSIADTLGQLPLYTLGGVVSGLIVGSIVGLLLRLFGLDGLTGLGAAFGLALGLVAGTIIDTRKGPKKA